MKPDHKFDGEETQNLRSTLKAIKPALVVLSSMCRVAGLSAGERKANEMLSWIVDALNERDRFPGPPLDALRKGSE